MRAARVLSRGGEHTTKGPPWPKTPTTLAQAPRSRSARAAREHGADRPPSRASPHRRAARRLARSCASARGRGHRRRAVTRDEVRRRVAAAAGRGVSRAPRVLGPRSTSRRSRRIARGFARRLGHPLAAPHARRDRASRCCARQTAARRARERRAQHRRGAGPLRGDRLHLFRIALGSHRECNAVLDVAVALGWLEQAPLAAERDRLGGLLYGLQR